MTLLPESTWRLVVLRLDRAELPDDWESNPDPWRAFADAREVYEPVYLRTRRTGDRFRPLGMRGRTVSLSDFLTNRKVPRSLRDRLPLLVDGRGIAWVCGHRIDERVRVYESTETALLLRFVKRAG